jgi:glutathione S-transferase
MKLFLNKASPYARLVQVVAAEKGLAGQLELVWTDPWQSSDELLAVNPYAKVPALVTDQHESIVDSTCICDYLDSLEPGQRLLPSSFAHRTAALRKYGLGRGLIDVSFGVVIERRFAGAHAESRLAARWLEAIHRALRALEAEPAVREAPNAPDLGDLSIAVGLSYIEFRLPEIKWRESSPQLSAWFDRIAARPSVRSTAPE